MVMGNSSDSLMYSILEYKTNKLITKKCSTPADKQHISYDSKKVFIHDDAKPDDVLTLATRYDLITYDPKIECALKIEKYSCVFSHLTQRIRDSNYVVTPSPGFRMLFIGEMIFDITKKEYDFKLQHTLDLTSIFLEIENIMLMPSVASKQVFKKFIYSNCTKNDEGNDVLELIIQSTEKQLYIFEFEVIKQGEDKIFKINDSKSVNLNFKHSDDPEAIRRAVAIDEWGVLLFNQMSPSVSEYRPEWMDYTDPENVPRLTFHLLDIHTGESLVEFLYPHTYPHFFSDFLSINKDFNQDENGDELGYRMVYFDVMTDQTEDSDV